jgi:hypothetical protein
MGHFGVKKTKDVLATHFFWPKMRRDVERYVSRCTIYSKAKSWLNPHGLYIPLPVPSVTWEDIFMDFVFRLPRTKRGDSIFMIVDHFSKIAHFIPCHKSDNTSHVTNLFWSGTNLSSKHVSPHKIDGRVKLPKFSGFKFKPRQVNYSSQSNKGTDNLVSQSSHWWVHWQHKGTKFEFWIQDHMKYS